MPCMEASMLRLQNPGRRLPVILVVRSDVALEGKNPAELDQTDPMHVPVSSLPWLITYQALHAKGRGQNHTSTQGETTCHECSCECS